MLIENLESHARLLDGGLRTIQLRCGSDEHAELVRQYTGLGLFRNPIANCLGLLVFALERLNRRRRAVPLLINQRTFEGRVTVGPGVTQGEPSRDVIGAPKQIHKPERWAEPR